MRLGIIGQGGQLARALMVLTEKQNIETKCYGRQACDLSAPPKDIEKFVTGLDIDALIIAAAYTAVDKAEDDYDTAHAVNAAAPEAIARACVKKDIALVHVSTDYVFQGKARVPYTVDAPTDPINAYGRTKLIGEQSILKAHSRAAVLRTSWVFDGSGNNFMTTMLRFGQAREELSVVSDQFGRPTNAAHLAQACLDTALALGGKDGEQASGLYHVTNSGEAISWAEFAQAIFARAKNDLPHAVKVTPIPSSGYPTHAKRPAYSVLDTSCYETRFKPLPHWREALEQAYLEWVENK